MPPDTQTQAYQPLQPADALADAAELPFSPRYGDVYHTAVGAMAQAEQVFLRGNGLPERWRGRQAFVVCETGFGLGLSFLALYAAWRADPARCERLHVISLEAHPFSVAELEHWHERVLGDEVRRLAAELRAAWPPLLPGLHRLELAGGAVTLTLGLGEAGRMAPRLQAAVDAYFLDGFAPARNPAMWSPALLADLGRLAAPGATLATWTSAGAVRRALAEAGFAVRKVPGIAGKWEMTVGSRAAPGAASRATEAVALARPPGSAVVVGGGLAGTGVAAALARRGWQVTQVVGAATGGAGPGPQAAARTPVAAAPAALSARGGAAARARRGGLVPPGGGAARGGAGPGHHAAALTPVADAQDSIRSRWVRAGALRASALWRPWTSATDIDAEVLVAGTLQVAGRKAGRSAATLEAWRAGLQALEWPAEWLRLVGPDQAAALAGQPVGQSAAFYGAGLRVRAGLLCQRWRSASGVREYPGRLQSWQPLSTGGGRLRLDIDGNAEVIDADVVVLAAGGDTPHLLRLGGLPTEPWPCLDSLHHVAGQISGFAAAELPRGSPRCIVAGDGYVLPAVEGWCVAGSTYDHEAPWGSPPPVRGAGHAANQARLLRLLPEAGLGAAEPPPVRWGWAGWRAVTADRLPVAGWVHPGVAVATAFGSRGLAWAGLVGEMLAADLAGEPASLEHDLREAVSPFRSSP